MSKNMIVKKHCLFSAYELDFLLKNIKIAICRARTLVKIFFRKFIIKS